MKSTNDSAYKKFSWAILIAVATGFLVAVGSYSWKFWSTSLSNDPSHWGVFGDFIGGTLNPLIAFLALLALLRVIRLEANALETAKKELEATSVAFREQNRNDRFFKLIDLLKQAQTAFDTVDAIDVPYANLPPYLEDWRDSYERGDFGKEPKGFMKACQSLYYQLFSYQEYRTLARSASTIYDFLHREALDEEDKRFYFDALGTVLRNRDIFCISLWLYPFKSPNHDVPPLWDTFDEFAQRYSTGTFKTMHIALSEAKSGSNDSSSH